MSPNQHDDELLPKPSAIEEVALAWVTRCDRGLTPAEEREFQAWLDNDPRHRVVFEDFNGVFDLVSRTGESRPSNTVKTAASSSSGGSVRHVAWHWIPLGAAAALVLGYFAWWRPTYFTGTLETTVGEVRVVKLPDGSSVELNTQSAVSVSFRPGERRLELLRGEGHFKVAKDSARPFVVAANGVAVQAVGTMFNVRLRSDSVDVLVTEGKVQLGSAASATRAAAAPAGASTGSIDRVSGAGEPGVMAATPASNSVRGENLAPVLLTAGHRASIGINPGMPEATLRVEPPKVVVVQADEMRRELAWQDRRLEFESARLAEIVEEMNRYHRRKLVIADPALAARRFGGSFRADDREGLVRMLQENFGVVVDEAGGESLIRPGAAAGR